MLSSEVQRAHAYILKLQQMIIVHNRQLQELSQKLEDMRSNGLGAEAPTGAGAQAATASRAANAHALPAKRGRRGT